MFIYIHSAILFIWEWKAMDTKDLKIIIVQITWWKGTPCMTLDASCWMTFLPIGDPKNKDIPIFHVLSLDQMDTIPRVRQSYGILLNVFSVFFSGKAFSRSLTTTLEPKKDQNMSFTSDPWPMTWLSTLNLLCQMLPLGLLPLARNQWIWIPALCIAQMTRDGMLFWRFWGKWKQEILVEKVDDVDAFLI